MVRIVFTASNTTMGKMIRWVTNGKCSHTFIQLPLPPFHGDFAIQAAFPKVEIVPISRARYNIVGEYACGFECDKGFEEIQYLIGEWYDFRGLALFGSIKVLWKLFKKKVKAPWQNAKAQFCSELVARFFMECKLPNTRDWIPERITPEDLRKYCANNIGTFTQWT